MPKQNLKKPHKPLWVRKEGNVAMAYFRNKNAKGSMFGKFCITCYKFPFKYNQQFYLSVPEFDRLKVLISQIDTSNYGKGKPSENNKEEPEQEPEPQETEEDNTELLIQKLEIINKLPEPYRSEEIRKFKEELNKG